MKRLLIGILLLSAVLAASGQDRLGEIASRISTNRILVDYSCTVSGEVPVKLKGTVLLQDDCYCMKGNGLEIYCNGGTRWTLDREAKEAYIEPANGLEEIMQYYESITDLVISNARYMPKSEDLGAFTFSTSDLDSSWIVTDLR